MKNFKSVTTKDIIAQYPTEDYRTYFIEDKIKMKNFDEEAKKILEHIFRWGHSTAERKGVKYFREEKKKAKIQTLSSLKDLIREAKPNWRIVAGIKAGANCKYRFQGFNAYDTQLNKALGLEE